MSVKKNTKETVSCQNVLLKIEYFCLLDAIVFVKKRKKAQNRRFFSKKACKKSVGVV